MKVFTAISARLRIIACIAIMVALFFDAFVPQGAMLERDAATGKVLITICSAQGSQSRWLDLETRTLLPEGQMPSEHDEQPQETCAYAGQLTAALGDAPHSVQYLTRIAVPFLAPQTPVQTYVGQSPSRLSARGPPVSI